jgi:drug/metabolite transporter (DMT)-like permease
MVIVALAMGGLPALFRLDLNSALFVILAAVIGFGIGDTCLFRSIGLIGASRSYTIGYSYPFLAIALATLLLGEPFQLRYMIGATIIFFAITSIFVERNIGVENDQRNSS